MKRLWPLALCLAACSGGTTCPNDLPASCPAQVPSYANDIAPLIESSCFPCHAPGGVEAVTLLNDYPHVFFYRSSVLDQVYHCEMPQSGSLTAEQRATLLAWLVCNSPDN